MHAGRKFAIARRRIGQEALFPREARRSSLDEIADLIDWSPVEAQLSAVYAEPRGEASWTPLALFRALMRAAFDWHQFMILLRRSYSKPDEQIPFVFP